MDGRGHRLGMPGVPGSWKRWEGPLPGALWGSPALQMLPPPGQRGDKHLLLKPLPGLMCCRGPRTLTPDATTTCHPDALILPQVSDFQGIG